MNSGMIAAFAALSGSIVGALGSVVGTWITQRHQDLRDLTAATEFVNSSRGGVKSAKPVHCNS